MVLQIIDQNFTEYLPLVVIATSRLLYFFR